MAKVMPFTDPYGNALEASYWKIVQVNIGVADKTGMVLLYGYVSKSARDTAKQNIGQKQYSISGAQFDALMAKHLKPGGPNLLSLAYTDVVNATDDVPAPTEKDPNAKKNFFADAEDALDA